ETFAVTRVSSSAQGIDRGPMPSRVGALRGVGTVSVWERVKIIAGLLVVFGFAAGYRAAPGGVTGIFCYDSGMPDLALDPEARARLWARLVELVEQALEVGPDGPVGRPPNMQKVAAVLRRLDAGAPVD